MNRDNLLFLVIGVLAGFLGGYMLQESMAAVQPPRTAAAEGGFHGVGGAAGPMMGGDPNAAASAEIERLRQALEANPTDESALIALANLNFDIQRWDRARELYVRYLALHPDDADAHTDLGICQRAAGEFDAALESFAKAQALAPDHWQSVYNEVVVRAFDLGDHAAALAALEKLERLAPGNPDVARLATEVRSRQGSG
ncbi:MAG: tetratricopeptide repeat protein [Acidobacteria bacterium]|nr:tetratricopeptide repeat protein [Acidobacteriota bacterium]MCB9378770.1 tetratricopeptide repeat protein [Holophagales bacterium]